jgi:hypothetical protein
MIDLKAIRERYDKATIELRELGILRETASDYIVDVPVLLQAVEEAKILIKQYRLVAEYAKMRVTDEDCAQWLSQFEESKNASA